MMEKYILVLDAGTGAAKVSLFSFTGELVYSAYKEWHYVLPVPEDPEIREFDPDHFWGIFCQLIGECLSSSRVTPQEIAAVTSTSQREGLVLLDDRGREIYAAPNLDFRAREQAEHLSQACGEEIYHRAGHWPHAIFALARLLWFKENRPEVYEKARTLLLINDWLLYKLSGEKVCEPSNASETLLFNLKEIKWDEYLLDKFHLPPELFPRVALLGDIIGAVTPKAAVETGILEGTPVMVGGADTQCAVLGAGGCRPGHVVAVCGTSTPVQSVVAQPLIDPQARIWTGCHVVPGQWVLDSNVRPSGVVYRWLRDTLYAPAGAGFEEMNEEAEQVPVGSNGVMSFLGPSISNVKDQIFYPGIIIGLKPGYEKYLSHRGFFTRSLLENIAYAVKGNMEQLEEVAGVQYPCLYVTGGGIKGRIFLDILAQVLGKPVQTTASPEATSLGAAIGAACGLKIYSSIQEACQAMVRYGKAYFPDPGKVEIYQELYTKWRKLDALLIKLHKKAIL